jgi:hypothetical protein
MSPSGVPTSRRRWRGPALVVGALLALLAAGAGWVVWTVDRVWDRLDSAAGDFEVPPGFTQVARLRQGSAFCWVTCTDGGEAVVTLVFETDARDPEEACRALRPAVVDLTGDATEPGYAETCGWRGDLGGSATVYAVAGPRTSYGRNSGSRWTEEIDAPDTQVVAFVEFTSGLE